MAHDIIKYSFQTNNQRNINHSNKVTFFTCEIRKRLIIIMLENQWEINTVIIVKKQLQCIFNIKIYLAFSLY